jgi:CxxC-x17-CxxC domain-containing protein
MENNRDEHIVCSDCGASFLFSAGEAAVFEERGLAAPKRCKDCRRARKDRNAAGGGGFDQGRGQRPPPRAQQQGGGFGDRPPQGDTWGARRDGPPRAPRPEGPPRGRFGGGPPRYTGDVNEYRSPMQDGSWQQQHAQGQQSSWQGQGGGGFRQNAAPARRPPPRNVPGVYRDDSEYRAPMAHRSAAGMQARADRPRGPAPIAADRPQRPRGELFSITCNACGSQAEVPFKPAEGREVFCQACYRARKPV